MSVQAAPTQPFETQGMPPAGGGMPQSDTSLPPPSLTPPPAPEDTETPPADVSVPVEGQPAAGPVPSRPAVYAIPWVQLAIAAGGGAGITLVVVLSAYWISRRRRGDHFSFGFFWSRIEARAIGAREFVEVDAVDPANTLTTQAVLSRGWSPELMEQVLGRADYAVLDPQRKREPLKLYNRQRVEQAEQDKKYQAFRAAVLDEKTRSEARIRKWQELRRTESEEHEPHRNR